MNIKCPFCNEGDLVVDFKKAYFLVYYDFKGDFSFEESPYEAEESNQVYCNLCGSFVSATLLDEIRQKLITKTEEK